MILSPVFAQVDQGWRQEMANGNGASAGIAIIGLIILVCCLKSINENRGRAAAFNFLMKGIVGLAILVGFVKGSFAVFFGCLVVFGIFGMIAWGTFDDLSKD